MEEPKPVPSKFRCGNISVLLVSMLLFSLYLYWLLFASNSSAQCCAVLTPPSYEYIPDDCRVSQLPKTNITQQYQTICAFGCILWGLSFLLALVNTSHSCQMLSRRLGVLVYIGLFALFVT